MPFFMDGLFFYTVSVVLYVACPEFTLSKPDLNNHLTHHGFN